MKNWLTDVRQVPSSRFLSRGRDDNTCQNLTNDFMTFNWQNQPIKWKDRIISKDTAEVSRPVTSQQNLLLNYEQNFKFYIYSQNSWLDPIDFVIFETSNFDMHWTTALFKMTLTLTVNETAHATKKETKSYPNSWSIKTRLMLFKVVLDIKKKKKTYENFYQQRCEFVCFIGIKVISSVTS